LRARAIGARGEGAPDDRSAGGRHLPSRRGRGQGEGRVRGFLAPAEGGPRSDSPARSRGEQRLEDALQKVGGDAGATMPPLPARAPRWSSVDTTPSPCGGYFRMLRGQSWRPSIVMEKIDPPQS